MNFQIDSYQKLYDKSINDPMGFWDDIADHYQWKERWKTTLEGDFSVSSIKWFKEGQLNITENCLDRHLAERGNKLAIIWEPNEPGDRAIRYTYSELFEAVCKYANVLKKKGVSKGDRVVIYMPMIPDLAISALACARIGAVHCVVLAGFSAQALTERINDVGCKVVLTSDGMYRGAMETPVKEVVDMALLDCPCVESVLVSTRTHLNVNMIARRDYRMSSELEEVDTYCPAETMNAEDMLFILHVTDRDENPQGIVHSCGGYMVYAGYSFSNVFQHKESDVHWCTADIGEITGHTYMMYGPLLNGATTLMFEGVPSYPNPGRFWQICDRHHVSHFYTGSTAIRALMTYGSELISDHKLTSLKVLGSAGEPMSKATWEWYSQEIGKSNCPVINTLCQTETGGILISGLAQPSPVAATYAGLPLPGIQPILLDENGNEIEEDETNGYLAIKFPWPGMLRTVYGRDEDYLSAYFKPFEGYFFTGNAAKRNKDGLYQVVGRVTRVNVNRSGKVEIKGAQV